MIGDDEVRFEELYWILGSRRDVLGTVQALCLAKAWEAGTGNTSGPAFAVQRIGL